MYKGETLLNGGGWKFHKNEHAWTMKIYKRVHDPEEANVTIGEVPPG